MNEELKVWLVISDWSNGRRFENDVLIDIYDNETSARNQFENLKEEAFECFRNVYGDDLISLDCNDNSAEIQANDYEDYWNGYIQETEVRH